MLLTEVPKFFAERRKKLVAREPGAAFIFPANPVRMRNPDVPYPYRQESNFFYLSGFDEPESFLMIVPNPKAKDNFESVLFVQKRDPTKELWDGELYGTEGAVKVFGVDRSFENTSFEKEAPELLKHCDRVFYRTAFDAAADQRVHAVLEKVRASKGRSGAPLLSILDPNRAVGEMRLFKGPDEVEYMRKAGEISAKAHCEAMKQTQPGMRESEIQALLEYEFKRQGCERIGYTPIVAGGKNACCLHYVRNNDVLNDGELLLIDAGGEYNYYSADITRTFPIGKEFTDAQAEIYDLVLKAQTECVNMVKPGLPYHDIDKHAKEVLTEGMLSLGLLKGKRDEIIKNNDHKKYYPHGTGHWLGMDVHDVGLYYLDEKSRPLEPGMVLTIEPGFYFQPRDKDYPEKFRNIGIRIEDDILVTDNGFENLTAGVPRERSEILNLIN